MRRALSALSLLLCLGGAPLQAQTVSAEKLVEAWSVENKQRVTIGPRVPAAFLRTTTSAKNLERRELETLLDSAEILFAQQGDQFLAVHHASARKFLIRPRHVPEGKPLPAFNEYVSRTYTLRFASGAEIHKEVSALLARDPRRVGSVHFNPRTRTLTISDLAPNVARYGRLIQTRDKQVGAFAVAGRVLVYEVPRQLLLELEAKDKAKPGALSKTLQQLSLLDPKSKGARGVVQLDAADFAGGRLKQMLWRSLGKRSAQIQLELLMNSQPEIKVETTIKEGAAMISQRKATLGLSPLPAGAHTYLSWSLAYSPQPTALVVVIHARARR